MAPLNGVGVSHQWVYSLIWDDKVRDGNLWQHLRQPKSRRKHRAQAKSAGLGKIPNRVGIEHRSPAIEKRLTIGHWERDTVIYGHKQ
jgi:IS30 family transposase